MHGQLRAGAFVLSFLQCQLKIKYLNTSSIADQKGDHMVSIGKGISTVFNNGKYLGTALAVAVVLFLIYVFGLTNVQKYTAWTWVYSVIFSLLFGIVIALQIYYKKEVKANVKVCSGVGVIAGAATGACAACPSVILGLVGAGGALGTSIAGLKLNIWLQIIGLVLLVVALHYTSKSLPAAKQK